MLRDLGTKWVRAGYGLDTGYDLGSSWVTWVRTVPYLGVPSGLSTEFMCRLDYESGICANKAKNWLAASRRHAKPPKSPFYLFVFRFRVKPVPKPHPTAEKNPNARAWTRKSEGSHSGCPYSECYSGGSLPVLTPQQLGGRQHLESARTNFKSTRSSTQRGFIHETVFLAKKMLREIYPL